MGIELNGQNDIVRRNGNLPDEVLATKAGPSFTAEEIAYLEALPPQSKLKQAYLASTAKTVLSGFQVPTVQALVSEDVIVARNRTWATLGAPADYIGLAYVTDVGLSGSLWRSDGATWGLVNGSVVLARGHTDLTVTAASVTEEDLASIPIPAGLMGANGMLEVTHFWEATNNANVKTMRVKLGGTAFFANATALGSSSIFLPAPTRIWNRNNQAAQMAFAAANGNTTIATGTTKTTGTVDTSAATTLAISGQKATGSDTLTLLGYSVRLVRP